MKTGHFPWKRIVAAVVVLAAIPIAWIVLQLPPPILIARYGLPPVGGLTGDSRLIANTTFVELSPGYFRRESPDGKFEWIEIAKPFWIATTELTNDAFTTFDPDHAPGANPLQPAVGVGYEDANRFCQWLTSATEFHVRLPTEEEWEYACRAGTTTAWYTGDDPAEVGNAAWFRENSVGGTNVVEMRLANAWQLADFHGNVAEWCSNADSGTGEGLRRAVRGGHYQSPAEACRSSVRELLPEMTRSPRIGFRPAAVLK